MTVCSRYLQSEYDIFECLCWDMGLHCFVLPQKATLFRVGHGGSVTDPRVVHSCLVPYEVEEPPSFWSGFGVISCEIGVDLTEFTDRQVRYLRGQRR